MKTTIKAALIYGGPSAEYDVSVNTAKAIRENIDTNKYSCIDVHITKQEEWMVDGVSLSEAKALDQLKNADLAILAVHGTYGEDGKLQQLLTDHGITFTGSDAAASSLAMNKIDAGQAFESAGLNVPKTFKVTDLDTAREKCAELTLPFVVKPVSQGSSFGVSIVQNREQLASAVDLALEHDDQIIIQEFISGREVSCGVIETEDGTLQALPPTELIAANGADFFDYEAKYTAGAGKEITPPDMPDSVISDIQDIAVKAHEVIGCHGYSRTDMIVREDGICVIEINTLPGMTKASILPQEAMAAGISFPQLIDRIVDAALARKRAA